ncbi:hypothetical protein EC988_005894, partial [Linderina pennispora]
PEATNSLVVTFDHYSNAAADALHAKLSDCGTLWHFAKLPSFARCLAVFTETGNAQTAMRTLNRTAALDTNHMYMYYSMHTSLQQAQDNFLHVPAEEKLWLISPPGSPPIDWRQTREEPPNSRNLERGLERALRELGSGGFVLNPQEVEDYESAEEGLDGFSLDGPRQHISKGGVDEESDEDEIAGAMQRSRIDGQEDHLPTIFIQNYDTQQDGGRLQSSMLIADRPPTPGCVGRMYQPTARPPM